MDSILNERKKMMNLRLTVLLTLTAILIASLPIAADTTLKPYFIANDTQGNQEENLPKLRDALTAQGFEIVGEYTPYTNAYILAFTSDELKETAAKSTFGGYGAVLRLSLTESKGKLQVAWNNPEYIANVYQMASSLAPVREKLEAALGKGKPFGCKKGKKAKALRSYHYMMMMPYFDDHHSINKSESHEEAVKAVEAGLAAGKGGTEKIYRVDIPGKDEVVFGVAIKAGKGADKAVMGTCDFGDLKHTPHLPYEILVSGNTAYTLHGKFRIALSFPDLSMGTFMKISKAPKSIKKALAAAAGAK